MSGLSDEFWELPPVLKAMVVGPSVYAHVREEGAMMLHFANLSYIPRRLTNVKQPWDKEVEKR